MLCNFVTPNFHGYACEQSPFDGSLISIAASQYFGVVGNGKLIVFKFDIRNNFLSLIFEFDSKDGVFDCSQSELNESHIITACGDGSIKLWDLKSNQNPLRLWREHQKEIYSVDQNNLNKEQFISSSQDKTIKLFNFQYQNSLATFGNSGFGHSTIIYNAVQSPYLSNCFASCGGDGILAIWDTNNCHKPLMKVKAHDAEILSCDQNKYDKNIIATGSVDKTIRVWDLRNLNYPISQINGHRYAVRRIKFSPHSFDRILSTSYDMSAAIFSIIPTKQNQIVNERTKPQLLQRFDHHTEFVIGCSQNYHIPNLFATCSQDESLSICKAKQTLGRQNRQLIYLKY